MLKSTCVFGLVALCLLVSAAALRAEEEVPLAFKFAAGDVMQYEVSVSGSGGLRAPDGELAAAGMQGSFSLVCTVSEVLPDGSGQLQVKMPKAEVQLSVGQDQARFSYDNGRMRWYANGKEHIPPESDLGQVPLLGMPLTVTVAPNGRLTDVVLPPTEALSAMQQMVPGIGVPQTQNLGEQIFPDEPVKVGQTWQRAAQLLPFGSTMPVTVTTSRTLASYTNEGGIGLARITGYTDVRFRTDPVTVSPGEAPVMVAVPELRETVTSTEFFNTAEGRLVRADYDIAFSTKVGVEMGEQKQEAGLEARFRVAVQSR
jgi:hypothetical protein